MALVNTENKNEQQRTSKLQVSLFRSIYFYFLFTIFTEPRELGFFPSNFIFPFEAPIMLLTGHEEEIFAARFSTDGTCLATAGFDQKVFYFEILTFPLLTTFVTTF